MTDSEFQIFTQFKVHVFSICDKLTSNHWRKVTSNHIEALTRSASSVSASLQDSLEKVRASEKCGARERRGNSSHIASFISNPLFHSLVSLAAPKHDHLIKKSDELHSTLVDSHQKTIDTMETSHKESISRAEEIRMAQESMQKTVHDTTLTLDNMRQSVDFIGELGLGLGSRG